MPVLPLLLQRRAESRVWALALGLASELSYSHGDEVAVETRDRVRSLIERDLIEGSDPVRAAAAEGLRWWGDPRDCQALVECLNSPSHLVRAAATSSLETLAERVPGAVEAALLAQLAGKVQSLRHDFGGLYRPDKRAGEDGVECGIGDEDYPEIGKVSTPKPLRYGKGNDCKFGQIICV